MKLLRADITEFAGLHDRSFEFGEGMNIIEGKNESGKSTLLAFIKFILYGFTGRASGSEPAERDRYLSWSGRRAAGSLTLSAGGRLWRIERDGSLQTRGGRSSYNEKPVQMIDTATGTVEHRGECPGELLLGIGAAVFSSSCCTAQLESGGVDGGEVGSCIENMLLTADKSISVKRSCDRLDKTRVELLHKNGRGGRIFDLQNEISSLQAKSAESERTAQEILRKEALAAELSALTDEARRRESELDTLWEKSEALLMLSRFDECRRLDSELDALNSQLDALRRDSFPDGFVPTAEHAARLGLLSRELDTAEDGFTQAELNLHRQQASPSYDAEKASAASRLEANGIKDKSALTGKYQSNAKASATFSAAGTVLLVCGILAICGGVILLAVAKLLLAGVITAAFGAAATAAGILCLVRGALRRKSWRGYLSRLGIPPDSDADALAGYVDACLAAREGEKNHRALLTALHGVTETRRSRLASLTAEARRELSRFGIGTGGDDCASLTAALSDAAARVTAFLSREDVLVRRIQGDEREVRSLRESLAQCDESFLRQRVSRLQSTEEISAEEYSRRREDCRRAVREANDRQTAVEMQLIALRSRSASPARLAAETERCETELETLSIRAEALTLAKESIETASGQLRRGFTPRLKREAAQLMSSLTDTRYSDLGVSDDLSLSLPADGATRSVGLLSGGTRDAAYLSLRLALSALLCPVEPPPVLLDESFAQLDDDRAGKLIGMLCELCAGERQCLIFTCHGREAGLAKNFRHIML